MSVLGIVLMVVFGFCAGILARAQLHGSDNVVATMTALSAILGALLGGFIGNAIWKPREGARITFSMFLKGVGRCQHSLGRSPAPDPLERFSYWDGRKCGNNRCRGPFSQAPVLLQSRIRV